MGGSEGTGWVGAPTPHPPIPSGPEVLEGLNPEVLNFWASPEIHLPQSDEVPYSVAQWGGSKPFSNICGGKKTAPIVMACNGISPKGCDRAAVSCVLSHAVAHCAAGAEQNLAQSLKDWGWGWGGGVWNPPKAPLPLVLSCEVEVCTQRTRMFDQNVSPPAGDAHLCSDAHLIHTSEARETHAMHETQDRGQRPGSPPPNTHATSRKHLQDNCVAVSGKEPQGTGERPVLNCKSRDGCETHVRHTLESWDAHMTPTLDTV